MTRMKINFFNITICSLLALATVFTGCSKDLFDPEYEGYTTENPLGINAPADFDWSSLVTARISVTVKDPLLGKYDYLLEVYDRNPLYDGQAHLLDFGVARQGQPYTAEISYPQAATRLFIKQTDPRGRITVKSFAAAADGASVEWNFNSFSGETLTRAAGSNALPEYTYTAADIPADAEEIAGDSHDDWLDKNPRTSNFKITGNYTGGIYHNGGKNGLKLFVSGTWTIPGNETGNWKYSIERGLDVIVLPGGKIVARGSGKTLVFKATSNLIVMEDAKVECEGSVLFSNNGYLYNKGIVEAAVNFIMQSNSGFYNFCTVKTGENLEANAANSTFYQNKGVVTAKKIVFNNMEVRLLNGSMIKATERLDGMSHTSYLAEGENTSLIKSPVIECTNKVVYSGNLVIESDKHTPGGGLWWSPYELLNGASMAGYDQSEVVIEACDGTGNPGNPGGTPENPEYPIIIDTSGDEYIFAMEDSWPSYGDYDMNDVVVRFSRNKIALEADGSKAITYRAGIIATGATRPIAAAIQFDKVTTGQVSAVTYSNPEVITPSFKLNANGTEAGQTQAVIPFFANAKVFCRQNNNYINVGDRGITVDETSLPVQEITVRFGPGVRNEEIGIRNINFFITVNGTQSGRIEVHLAGYEPSDLGSKVLFGKYDDNSKEGKFKYLSKNSNLPWGLIIPTGSWKCPFENVSILKAYPDFRNWATSGGIENKDWFTK